jgi:hypothetical protein
MHIEDFLAKLVRDCDPNWQEQVQGIAEQYAKYGAITAKQKRAVEVETHKAGRHMPDGWAAVPLREPLTPSRDPVVTSALDREALANAFDELADAMSKAAKILRP